MKKIFNQNQSCNKIKQILKARLFLQQKNLKKIKKRILNIIDSQFQIIQNRMHQQIYRCNSEDRLNNLGNYIINQGKLQEWILTFQNQIIQWKHQNKKILHENIEQKNSKQLQDQVKCQQLILQQPKQMQISQKNIFKVQNNKLKIYKIDENKFLKGQKPNHKMIQQQTFSFNQNTLNKNCSLTYVQQFKTLFLIGGSLSKNPNLKSCKILRYSVPNKQIQQSVSSNQYLPYGISSHGSVYDEKNKQIYLIGGNRNYSVISRGCFKVKLIINCQNIQTLDYRSINMYIEQIACLNYPVASMSCIIWKDKWIYKIGGIGESFNQWGNSPYIQRYSIQLNQWQVINPSISSFINIQLISKFSYMANSLCYLTNNQDKLVILGGYSFQGQGSNYGMVIKLSKQQDNSQINQNESFQISTSSISNDNYHQIIRNFLFYFYNLDKQKAYKEVGLVQINYFLSRKTINKDIFILQLRNLHHKLYNNIRLLFNIIIAIKNELKIIIILLMIQFIFMFIKYFFIQLIFRLI